MTDEAFEQYQARPDIETLADRRAREKDGLEAREGVVTTTEIAPKKKK